MELETIRAIETGLNDPTIGINARIDALTLDPLTPSDTQPPHVSVCTSVDNAWVARRTVSEHSAGITYPALAVFVWQPVDFPEAEVETVVRDGHFPIALAYVTKKSDSALGNRDALYTNRALLRFFKLFNANGNAAMRLRNGVLVQAATSLVQSSAVQEWGSAMISAATLVTYLVRETAP